MTRSLGRGGSLLLIAASAAGCAGRPPVRPAIDDSGVDGRVGLAIELPGSEGEHRLAQGESATPPTVLEQEQPLPSYPRQLLAQNLPPVDVHTLASVDAAGSLAAIEFITPLSPDAGAGPGAPCNPTCLDLFHQSVRATLNEWTFGPLQVMGWIDGPDEDGDGEADSVHRGVVASRPYSLRLRFRFEQIDGRGEVSAESADDGDRVTR